MSDTRETRKVVLDDNVMLLILKILEIERGRKITAQELAEAIWRAAK